jgi:hypothetical protein
MSLGMKMSFRDFFRTFLATTISIVLTFGTSAVLERREKKQSQKQMCMMLLHDIDESMEIIKELRSAWAKAMIKARKEKGAS